MAARISRVLLYLFALQIVAFILLALFLKGGTPVSGGTGVLFLACALVSWSAAMALPPCLPALLSLNGRASATRPRRLLIYGLCALTAFLVHLFLISDRVVLGLFGYHVNGLVLNLLLTPGGIESMGLQRSNYALMGLGAALLFALEFLLAWGCLADRAARRLAEGLRRRAGGFALAWLLLTVLCLGVAFLCEGIADYKADDATLAQVETYPLFPYVRMRSFLRRLGVDEPARESLAERTAARGGGRTLRYPAAPVRRIAHERPNIVWLVAESLRADMLTEEIMPCTWRLAATRGVRFTRHYSGGHGTRPAMFSMFYGLHANCWDAFLRAARGPLLFDWLREDGYAFLCQTSAKFSYPEFDRTVFASMKDSELKEYPKGIPWQRDGQNIDSAIDFLRAHGGPEAPFFLFCFFEGTHAAYSFPEDEDGLIRPDYARQVNYALLDEKDAPRLKNRYINAAHRVDFQIGRLLAALDERPDVAARTIVVVTGDHGEEFYEKGRLGHNSTFVEEQIRTPLVIALPRQAPAVYERLSHHTDILPTIAPLLGVASAPEDYCVGGNLMDDAYERTGFLCFGWDTAVFAANGRKYLLPIGKKALFGNRLTTIDDAPVKDDGFLKDNAARLHRAQQEMTRFIGR